MLPHGEDKSAPESTPRQQQGGPQKGNSECRFTASQGGRYGAFYNLAALSLQPEEYPGAHDSAQDPLPPSDCIDLAHHNEIAEWQQSPDDTTAIMLEAAEEPHRA